MFLCGTIKDGRPVPSMETEAKTVEGRLADLMEKDQVQIGKYVLSAADQSRVIYALRIAASLK